MGSESSDKERWNNLADKALSELIEDAAGAEFMKEYFQRGETFGMAIICSALRDTDSIFATTTNALNCGTKIHMMILDDMMPIVAFKDSDDSLEDFGELLRQETRRLLEQYFQEETDRMLERAFYDEPLLGLVDGIRFIENTCIPDPINRFPSEKKRKTKRRQRGSKPWDNKFGKHS